MTTGVENTLIGGAAGDAFTDADYNVAIGRGALSDDTKGNQSVGIGYLALNVQNFTSSTDTFNTAVGSKAGLSVTTGTDNTLIGGLCGDAITDGNTNTAMGSYALTTNQRGDRNTAIGHEALKVMNPNGNSDSLNTAVGYQAGVAITTGVQNTFIGGSCANTVSSGNFNTVIGMGGLGNVTTGENCIGIGNGTTTSASNSQHQIVIGSGEVAGGGNNTVRFGNGSATATLDIDGSDTSWAAASDLRLKKDVANSPVGLAFIKDLRPVTFKWNAKNAVANNLPQYDADLSDPVFGEGKAHHGFIAQEVKAVIDAHSDVVNGHNIWSEDPNGTQQIAYGSMMPMMVKAVQELSTALDAALARIATLEG